MNKVARLLPDQSIVGLDGLTVGDFWSWAYSDVLSNRNRAIFAEFLVGSALGVIDEPRVEWNSVDLRYRGKGIEVKSAAYVQSWAQTKPSVIAFDIAKKLPWEKETNTYLPDKTRSSDCYVFCLYPEKDRAAANVLDVPRWQFYVAFRDRLDVAFGDQRSIALNRLAEVCTGPVSHAELRAAVDRALFPLAQGEMEQQ